MYNITAYNKVVSRTIQSIPTKYDYEKSIT